VILDHFPREICGSNAVICFVIVLKKRDKTLQKGSKKKCVLQQEKPTPFVRISSPFTDF